MSLVGASAIRLFESELFLFSIIVERTDRRIVVWPVKHHAAHDLDTRAQRDWVGRKPAGRMHGAENIFLAANKPDIERISWNTDASACHHGQGSQARLMLVMGPKDRKRDISQHQIDDWHGR